MRGRAARRKSGGAPPPAAVLRRAARLFPPGRVAEARLRCSIALLRCGLHPRQLPLVETRRERLRRGRGGEQPDLDTVVPTRHDEATLAVVEPFLAVSTDFAFDPLAAPLDAQPEGPLPFW